MERINKKYAKIDSLESKAFEKPKESSPKKSKPKAKFEEVSLEYSPCRKNFVRIQVDKASKKIKCTIEADGKILGKRTEDYKEGKLNETLSVILDQYKALTYKIHKYHVRGEDFSEVYEK